MDKYYQIAMNKELTDKIYGTANYIINNAVYVDDKSYYILEVPKAVYTNMKNIIEENYKEFKLFGLTVSYVDFTINLNGISVFSHED